VQTEIISRIMITSAQRRRQILPEIASVVNSHRDLQISTEDSGEGIGQGKQAAEQPSRNGPYLGHGKRNMFAQQEATQLTRANEVMRRCFNGLSSVADLDDFLGQMMAAMTRQLGAVASTLRMRNFEQNTLPLEFVFQDGRVMSTGEAKYPERWRSVSLEQFDANFLCHSACKETRREQRVATFLDQPAGIVRIPDPCSPMPKEQRSYLRALGVKAVLIVPLVSRGEVNGRLTFRFTEERDFHPDELEIAQALATQASLAVELIRLARAAQQAGVLEERDRLAREIHDSLAQSFAGIALHLSVAEEEMAAGKGSPLRRVRFVKRLAESGLAESRHSALSLRSTVIEESGLVEGLRMLVERWNVVDRVRCYFRTGHIPEKRLPVRIQHDLLRIAQEAISNAVRHGKPTAVTVTLRWQAPRLTLRIKDNGSGIPKSRLRKNKGIGLRSMRERAAQIGAKLVIQAGLGSGTRILVTVPISV
jgi:signal transduction histidine kinase